jgi:hypothetical protein
MVVKQRKHQDDFVNILPAWGNKNQRDFLWRHEADPF